MREPKNCGLRIADCGLQAKAAAGKAPAHAKLERLADRPRYRRAGAKGLAAATAEQVRIEPSGGELRAGLIRGTSLCTRGEALGHDLWIDSQFIESVSTAGSSSGKGVKARFTHPGLSSDGLGTFLGWIKDCRAEGSKAVGDLHFSQAAHRTPDGDLAQYVMELAESDPEAFAMSIVFDPDYEAEGEFILANGGRMTASGYIDNSDFVSPDPDNTRNLPHARLAALRGCDVVDEPAANPDGLFHREQQFAQEAEGVLSYALGLSKTAPACVALSGGIGLHPERVKIFVAKFLDAHGLQLTSTRMKPNHEETAMLEETTAEAETTGESQGQAEAAAEGTQESAAADSQEEAKPEAAEGSRGPAAGSQEEAKPEAEAGETAATASDSTEQSAIEGGPAACGRFIAAFGARGGQWYAEGLSFEAAQQRHAEALTAENAELRKRLAAAGEGETKPLAFQPTAETGGRKQFTDVIKIRGGK